MQQLSASSSFSSAFEEDSPEFLEAITTTIFPGEILPDTKNLHLKRKHSEEELDLSPKHSQECLKNSTRTSGTCDENCYPEDRPLKRGKCDIEPEFVQGSSKDVEICSPVSPPHPEHDNDQTIKPLYTSDPASFKDASRVPGYAANKPNEHAEKLMENPDFRSTRTSAAGAEFIDNFYKNSRLHHLSMWKVELRALVAEAQERAEKLFARGKIDDDNSTIEPSTQEGFAGKVDSDEISGTSMRGSMFQPLRTPSKSKGKTKDQDSIGSENKVIMHCDFDCFFVSVGLLTRPYLKDQPVVVCHSQGNQGRSSSTSEVSSANYKARESGIRAGMR